MGKKVWEKEDLFGLYRKNSIYLQKELTRKFYDLIFN